MQSFDVLNRNTIIYQSHLLEASAGTGKTFALEHLFVRLLLENDKVTGEPLRVDTILAVTFTRASARDLRGRIQQAIQKSIEVLKGEKNAEEVDYLAAMLEEGGEKLKSSLWKLQEAQIEFDRAPILTIHGFCSRILSEFQIEGQFAVDPLQIEGKITQQELKQIVRDFFRTRVSEDTYPSIQWQMLLGSIASKSQSERLEAQLKSEMAKPLRITAGASYKDLLVRFCGAMSRLKEGLKLESDKLAEDLTLQSQLFRKCSGLEEFIPGFAALFAKDAWSSEDFNGMILSGIPIVEAFVDEKLKKNKKTQNLPVLFYPDLLPSLKRELAPIIEMARNPSHIFANMASECQELFQHYLDREEKMCFDHLLKQMHSSLQNPKFREQVRAKFKAVLIDEFQDTDPTQWDIFRTLFLKGQDSMPVILVGDPKQSIYAFRQADIYTYLSAAKEIGSESHRSLDTNFRSQPSLVNALNLLFGHQPIFELPETGGFLDYRKVKSSKTVPTKIFQDGLGALHFFSAMDEKYSKASLQIVEQELLFPFIASQIRQHIISDGFNESQIAVLVNDRNQGQRLGLYFDKCGIPFNLKRTKTLTESRALVTLLSLIRSLLRPNDIGLLKQVLGCPLFSWTLESLKRLDDQTVLENEMDRLKSWQDLANEKGAITAIYDILQVSPYSNTAKTLLMSQGGQELYDDLRCFLEIAAEEMHNAKSSLRDLLLFFESIAKGEIDEEHLTKRNGRSKGVQVVTIHSSKGLEFPIVFALGLICRPPKTTPWLIPSSDKRGLEPLNSDKDSCYVKYCLELDAEKMRQLYVAMTRAKYRLYVPLWIHNKNRESTKEKFSPIELLINRLWPNFELNSLQSIFGAQSELASWSEVKANLEIPKAPEPLLTELFPNKTVKVPQRTITIQSFTSIMENEPSKEVKRPPLDYPQNFQNPVKSVHTLPANAETGLILHHLLEKIPLQLLQKANQASDLYSWLQIQLLSTPYETWMDSLAELVWNAISTPFLGANQSLSLAQSNAFPLIREMEFIYPSEVKQPFVEELTVEYGYLKGVIDLVCGHENRYAIVDWKSNWLGPDAHAYTQENLEISMRDHGYFLQAELYANALRKHLRCFQNSDPWHFEGCYYVFLRGLDGESKNGIYFIPSESSHYPETH